MLKALPMAAVLASCGRKPYERADFPAAPRSTVGIFPAPTYDVDFADVISRGLRELGIDVKGRSVLLKPNLVEYAPGTVINTHPLVVAGAATAFLRAGAREVVIGEAPGHRRDVEYLLSVTGLADHLREMRLRFVDLNHDDVRMTALKSHFTAIGQIALPVEVLKSDFVVSLPKLKTHHWAAMTASMKNFFGVVPGAVYGWPKNILHQHGIDNSILDLNATVRPQFTIVDAVVAMEGDGPIMGTPRQMGFLAMGGDLVAVDATCARIIGLDPAKITYLSEASGFLGHISPSRIDQRGENPSRYRTRFDMLPQFKPLQLTDGA
ncbi:MAG TPA: DUF362 domain-containing protein [Vicinamibacterales bacterium]|nr:DUF362 domain-containing protein [Vicinamibacterales bacterium]